MPQHRQYLKRWRQPINEMRIVISIFCVIFLGCNDNRGIRQTESTVIKKSKYDKLLTLYKSISIDTLKVYSAEDPDNINFKYTGTPIDSSNAFLFPRDIAKAHFDEPPGLFACYRFALDSNREALITRTPSTYVPSSIKLFIFDKSKDTIDSFVELAELVGDAGDLLTKNSWVIRHHNNSFSAFVWQKDTHDHSVDEEPDSFPENFDYYWLIDLSKAMPDILSHDSVFLANKYKDLLNQ